jgi:hypothetical protein
MGMPGGTSWLNETAAVLPKGKNHCIGETYVGWFIDMVTELSQRDATARICSAFALVEFDAWWGTPLPIHQLIWLQIG